VSRVARASFNSSGEASPTRALVSDEGVEIVRHGLEGCLHAALASSLAAFSAAGAAATWRLL